MDGGTRSNQGYEIIEGCTIGNTELVIGHHPKPRTLMYAGTARAATTTIGAATATPLKRRGKS